MKIHVYPGMGATADMYTGAWKEFNFIFHDWPKYTGELTMEEYVKSA